MKLVIVMATYNGAGFIEEQIKSIQAQTVADWSLIIRDDGSKDDTVEQINRLAKTDCRITLLQDGLGNLGVVQNFARLMQVAVDVGADYVAISDQDDVWRDDKLQRLLAKIKETESAASVATPALVHSDLEVVDEAMHTIAESFMKLAGIACDRISVAQLLCQNSITGCTCLINQTLLKMALPVPRGVPMHDWWLALLALSCGKVGCIDQPLVRYRQHSGNTVGANSNVGRAMQYALAPGKWRRQIANVHASIGQAGALIDRLKRLPTAECDNQTLSVIREYAGILDSSHLQRLQKLQAYGIHKRSWLSDFIFRFIVLMLPSRKSGHK